MTPVDLDAAMVTGRRRLLYLAHRIPFPPNKGDKIRSFHLLRHLAARHDVYLGSFVDDPVDWQYLREVSRLCRASKILGLDPKLRRLRSLTALASGDALSVAYYRVNAMRHWVDEIVQRERITHAVVFSSTMAQYVSGPRFAGLRRIADMCDVDSDKWRQYAQGMRPPKKWVYAREATRLLEYERRIAAEFDATLFVTAVEAELFRSLAPESAAKIGHFDNGVDIEYFDPVGAFENPYGEAPKAGPVIVFTGAMDYWANVDAVTWFADEVWPLIHAESPTASFHIVGSNPDVAVKALESRPGVAVTGRVPDIRPYLAHATVSVAPLRVARGTQNKVLEALAMEKPVVCTQAAAAGLDVFEDVAFRVEDDPARFASAVRALFSYGRNARARDFVRGRYSWDSHLKVVDGLLRMEPRG